MQRVHSIWVYFTLEGVIQNGSILKSRTHTTGHFYIGVAPPGSQLNEERGCGQEVLRESGTHLSHLEQRGSDQKVLRGEETQWSHLEQRRGDQEVLRGKATQWLHLDQRGSDQEVLRGDGIHWSHLEQRGDINEVLTCLANVTI